MTTTTTDALAGTLDVLSTGRGHLRLDIARDGEEKVRAVITDLLKRGAAILVEMPDGSTRRVKRFDPKRMVYLIDDSDALEALADVRTSRKREVPVRDAHATAVGRTAGG